MLSWLKHLWKPDSVRSGQPKGWPVTSFRSAPLSQNRNPTHRELLAELRTTAYACAMINAGVCASFPPKLYLRQKDGEVAPRAGVRRTQPDLAQRILMSHAQVPQSGWTLLEVTDHPILTLLRSVNEEMNGHELWETTALALELFGNAFWWIEGDPPESIWPLPVPRVRPGTGDGFSGWILDTTRGPVPLDPERMIHFRNPSAENPYGLGHGPMRAAYEPAALASRFHSYRRALWENAATPGVVLSTSQPLGEDEVERIESRWQQRFGRGGSGKLLVTDADFKVSTIQYSPADLASLAEAGATREEIANAFGVPLAFLTSDTNLANLQAAEHQHRSMTILPRLRRRDDRLNEMLVKRMDPTGRLFLAADNPVPEDRAANLRQMEVDLRLGVLTVDEVRRSRGLGPKVGGSGVGKVGE